jgi:hypothetical protein
MAYEQKAVGISFLNRASETIPYPFSSIYSRKITV